ncbi:uncharacterized protein BT62DRAFT_1081508 [Guyanagaster necrorhizus]|uniref:Uncharacterized protein n=1 Tax=Guyanagaster necrorhizus TaxID=856835 RepID=A0A9P7VFF0_9AGAR|nr:uncharacterized protein BT62DRAFT_1081508 [Guyanagaster necrorhizus MCA 3950]KAG7439555.1 hypothetical protein BT62DRAFT_1081508 [Guyanagaster necrorhizus MCA 3950]
MEGRVHFLFLRYQLCAEPRRKIKMKQASTTTCSLFFTGVSRTLPRGRNNDLKVFAGRYVDIPYDLWPEVGPRINKIKVISRALQSPILRIRLHYDQDEIKP